MRTLILCVFLFPATVFAQVLESWNDTAARSAILDFVGEVTTPDSESFVPPAERIAVFDNDGTLWSEKPTYFQLLFVLERVEEMAPEHPEWQDTEPFRSALAGDTDGIAVQGEEAILELVMATHAGMTTEAFAALAEDWISTARHPRFDRPYKELVYQPMLELLNYLREHEFKTYIISGGGIEFMRPWTEAVYGIPPEQVVGSSIVTRFELRDGVPTLVRLPEMNFLDDKAEKPVAINQHIGRRPIFAFGNSDGDLQMLQWTAAGSGARFAGLVHHTDAEREWAYDRESNVGRLDEALEIAEAQSWTVVDMAQDWKQVFPDP